ncbi:MAG: glycosyltransferase, partial [Proteobacteria bacterium]|nr:glycosyltransferase [Pseudomonadota bacterium]
MRATAAAALATLSALLRNGVYEHLHSLGHYLRDGMKQVLAKIKPDIVFAHESRQSLPALAAHYKSMFGYKLVVDQHDFYHKIPNFPMWKRFLRFLDYFLFRKFIVDYSLRKADKIIAVTEETKDFLIKTHKINSKKIALIPLGVDTDFFVFDEKVRNPIRKKYNIKNNEI